MLDEAPRLVHHADLQRGGFGGILNARDDAMQHVEQQRLQQHRIRAHRLEVEDLETLDGQRVLDVVEEAGVAPVADPLVQASGQRARQQVGQREQATLAAVEHVEVLDRLVDLAVLEVADAIAVVAFEQHAHEGVQEVQVLGRRLERERVDRDAVLPQPDLEISARRAASPACDSCGRRRGRRSAARTSGRA